jgi:hypothetical protein
MEAQKHYVWRTSYDGRRGGKDDVIKRSLQATLSNTRRDDERQEE